MDIKIPSVLAPSPPVGQGASADVFGSPSSQQAEGSVSRRQRISMACIYCRHRKIRCCGSAPCRNCTRSRRTCEYAAVPDEVNKATRERKANAKAAKHNAGDFLHSPVSPYSSYGFESPLSVSSAQMPSAATLAPPLPIGPPRVRGHRRAASQPINATLPPYIPPPPAPQLSSPAMFESSSWMYSGWSSTPPVPLASAPNTPLRSFPSVLATTPAHAAYVQTMNRPRHHQAEPNAFQSRLDLTPTTQVGTISFKPATPPDSGSESSGASRWPVQRNLVMPPPYMTSYPQHPSPLATPVHEHTGYAFMPNSPPTTPSTQCFYSPYPTPGIHQSQPFFYLPPSPEDATTGMDNSPTLAPEPPMHKGLVGLGIGVSMGVEEPSYAAYAPIEVDYYPTLPSSTFV